MGERTPHDDASARGALVGLTARTTKADISRAVLEGITFGLADSLELMRARRAGAAVADPRSPAAAPRAAFWRQLMADVFDAQVAVTTSTEGPAFGAAILGGVGRGAFASVEEGADALVHVTSRIAPDRTSAARYREIHAVYRGALRGSARPASVRCGRWSERAASVTGLTAGVPHGVRRPLVEDRRCLLKSRNFREVRFNAPSRGRGSGGGCHLGESSNARAPTHGAGSSRDTRRPLR